MPPFDSRDTRFATWQKFLVGCLALVFVSTSVSTLAAFSQRQDLVEAIKKNEITGLSSWLSHDPGGPQTLMLLGSDKRKGADAATFGKPRSDTIILVRLDPESAVTSMMSLPRDLLVDIPGVGRDKINIAYQHGGVRKTLQTVKSAIGVRVNHVINVNFTGFRQAVDQIGCVYIDVDRRYFNDNSNASYGDAFATIDIKQGYQRICGQNALDYVRYRHGDNDIIRGARQQDFLRQARNQAGVSELLSNAGDLKKIVKRNTRTSPMSGKELQQLLTLAARSAGKPVREVRISTEMRDKDPYVRASAAAFRKARRQFESTAFKKDSASTARAAKPRRVKKKKVTKARGLQDATAEGKLQAVSMRTKARMPVYYPTVRVATSAYLPSPRAYKIRIPGDKVKPAYRIVGRLTEQFGEYYGIQGTKWTDPPILKNPSESRRVGSRKLDLYFDGSQLAVVAWRRKGEVYWVSNTLSRLLTTKQMLGIASSLKRAR